MPAPLAIPLLPIPVSRPWGGRRIAPRFGWSDPGPRGEWWLASCRPEASTRLAGTAGNLDLAGWLDGPGRGLGCPSSASFPLLLKFLDSEQILSLQVHPDDTTAARHGLPSGKTEAWHILAAEPGARVFVGTAPGVSCAQLLDRVAAGADDAEVTSLLNAIDVAAGDTLLVPAGSVHATGPGLALFEVQQNSDTTYRIHDWGRGRPVHLQQARDAARDLPPAAPLRDGAPRNRWATLLDTPAFTLRRAVLDAGELLLSPARSFALLTVLAGHGRLRAGTAWLPLAPGDTLFTLGDTTLVASGAPAEPLAVLAVEPP